MIAIDGLIKIDRDDGPTHGPARARNELSSTGDFASSVLYALWWKGGPRVPFPFGVSEHRSWGIVVDTATIDTIASLQDIRTTPLDSLTSDAVNGIVERIVGTTPDPLAVDVALFQSAI